MNTCPLTLLFDYEHTNDRTRPLVMREFVANGCTNQVLTDTLISMMIQRPSFAAALRRDAEAAGVKVVQGASRVARHWPRGRPVAVKLTKYELEKMFKRA